MVCMVLLTPTDASQDFGSPPGGLGGGLNNYRTLRLNTHMQIRLHNLVVIANIIVTHTYNLKTFSAL